MGKYYRILEVFLTLVMRLMQYCYFCLIHLPPVKSDRKGLKHTIIENNTIRKSQAINFLPLVIRPIKDKICKSPKPCFHLNKYNQKLAFYFFRYKFFELILKN